ncbi:hypothetical protein [Streptomyces sp. Ag109_G2-15]|uniref:hypothetical protein n=1 Tax=Streptomyces sp. Ag109_G2-15 TaxID=1938850 RepID=UPI0015CEFCAE|nr:hypothetical protein [Streptomyces sp. Ag109_G2-15]
MALTWCIGQAIAMLVVVSACPQLDTHIQIDPTGEKLLPLTVKNAAVAPGGH